MSAAAILQSIADRLDDRAVFSLAVRRRLLSRRTLERLRNPSPDYDPRLPTVIKGGKLTGILLRCDNNQIATVRAILDSTQVFLELSYLSVGQLAERVGVNRCYLEHVMAGEHEIGLCLACRLTRCYSNGLFTTYEPTPAISL